MVRRLNQVAAEPQWRKRGGAMWKDQCNGIDFATAKRRRGTQGIFSCFADQRIGDKSTTHCISNCGGIQGIGRISYCSTGWLEGKRSSR